MPDIVIALLVTIPLLVLRLVLFETPEGKWIEKTATAAWGRLLAALARFRRGKSG